MDNAEQRSGGAMPPGPFQPPSPGSTGPSDGLRRAGSLAWSLLGVLMLMGVVGWLFYFLRSIFPPLILAVMLVFLLNPLVSRLERRGLRRSIATITIYIVFLAVMGWVITTVAPVFAEQGRQLAARMPELEAKLVSTIQGVTDRFGDSTSDANFREQLAGIRGRLFSGSGQVTRLAQGALHVVLIFVLGPIFALYLLIDLPKLQTAVVYYIPPRFRDEWLSLLSRCGDAVGGFFRGQLLVALIVGVMSSLVLLAVGIPFWLTIGMLAGFFNLIPLVGPFIGGALAAIVGASTGGFTKALWAIVAMTVVQQIDNHFISPNVMGRATRLHPMVVMVALLAGGGLAGLFGMLMAVPIAAVTKIIGLHYYETRVLHHPEMQEAPPLEPPRRAGTGRGLRIKRWLG